MSLIADGVQTLNEDIEVIAFLPGASYLFLLIAPEGDSELFFGLALLAAVVGAGFYNYLCYLKNEDGEDREEEQDEHKQEQDSPPEEHEETTDDWKDPRRETAEADEEDTTAEDIIVLVLLGSWGLLLLSSMYFLHQFFSKSWVLPEVLFFISFGVIAIYVTEGVLRLAVGGYGE